MLGMQSLTQRIPPSPFFHEAAVVTRWRLLRCVVTIFIASVFELKLS